MLKLRTKQKGLPLGGHHFSEKGFTFKGETLAEVITKLTAFRVDNNTPMGNPEQDILSFYESHSPWMVRTDEEAEDTVLDPLYLQWREWVYKTWAKPPRKYVTKKEATERWKICKGCPMNRKMDWDETNESAELVRRAFLLRRGFDAPDYLGFCACHKSDIAALSFIEAPRDFSQLGKDKENFSGCWV